MMTTNQFASFSPRRRPLPPLFLVQTLLAVVVLLAGGRSVWAGVRVVASVPDLAALAREIGGDAVSVKSLSSPTQDPHFVDAKPSLALELNRAQLVLFVGLDLEVGWLPTLLVGARNPGIQPGSAGHLDCSQFVKKLDVPGAAVDRSQGDIHPGGNPHYLYDPRAAGAVAEGIAKRLGELDPAQAAHYQANLASFKKRLETTRTRWEQRLAGLRGMPVIGYHRTWSYLADWLGFEQIGFLEPKPGVPPSPRHIAGLLALAKQRKVRLVLQEDHYPDATSRLVASRIPAALVRVPAATNIATSETYLQHVEGMLQAIAKGIGAP
ncbi:MAG TPA: metal ABC transporter substrate-binding protein [Polyangia bacterium]